MHAFKLVVVALLVVGGSSIVEFNILDDGAIGDGVTDNTRSIRQTLKRAADYRAPCQVLVPAGDFLTGSLQIPSNITLYLARRSILRASDNASLYSCVPSSTTDTGPCDFPFLLIDQAQQVVLDGPGVIDAGANSPPGHLVREYRPASNMLMPTEWSLPNCTYFSCRPKLFVIRYSQSITLMNITMSNSPLWTLTIVESEQILIDRVTIVGDRRWPNNDGIDLINSRHVSIRNSNISAGDDCIAIISHRSSPMFNITVENMDLQSTSAAIKVSVYESTATGDLSQMVFRQLRIRDTNRGICIAPRWGSASVRDLLFDDLTIETRFFGLDWWGTAEPIYITGLSKSAEQLWTGQLKNITLRNVVAVGEQSLVIRGNTSVLEEIHLENISMTIARWSNETAHPALDYRPSAEPQMSWAPVDGLFAMDIQGLDLRQISINYQAPLQPYYGICWNLTNVTDVTESDLHCHQIEVY